MFLVRTELYLYISEIYALQPTHILNIYIIWLIFFIIREKPFLSLIIFTFSLKVYFAGFYYRHTNSFSLYTCISLLSKALPTPFLWLRVSADIALLSISELSPFNWQVYSPFTFIIDTFNFISSMIFCMDMLPKWFYVFCQEVQVYYWSKYIRRGNLFLRHFPKLRYYQF